MTEVRTISVVVPCFNEEEVLEEFHRRMTAVADGLAPARAEVIYVDDCSRDRTPLILCDLASRDSRVKVLRLARNCGHQMAVTAGLDYADGDAVVVIDADLQDPPESIPPMIDLVRQGFDVVHAQRIRRQGEAAWKLATARLFYAGLYRLSRTHIVENCGDFRALSAPAVEASRHFREPHRFLRGLFAQIGFRQCVYRYERHARFAGVPKYTIRKLAKLASDGLFSFSVTPIKAILWTAMSLWGLSLVYLAVGLWAWLTGRSVPGGWTSTVLLLTVFTGLILASIAVIGSYVGRIFEQGQDRPMYWISDMVNIGDRPLRSGFESREMRLSGTIARMRAARAGARGGAVITEVKMPVFEEARGGDRH